MKSHFIGTNKCSRCGGTDANCYVCQSLSRDELAAELREQRRQRFFARRRATQAAKKTSGTPVQ